MSVPERIGMNFLPMDDGSGYRLKRGSLVAIPSLAAINDIASQRIVGTRQEQEVSSSPAEVSRVLDFEHGNRAAPLGQQWISGKAVGVRSADAAPLHPQLPQPRRCRPSPSCRPPERRGAPLHSVHLFV